MLTLPDLGYLASFTFSQLHVLLKLFVIPIFTTINAPAEGYIHTNLYVDVFIDNFIRM